MSKLSLFAKEVPDEEQRSPTFENSLASEAAISSCFIAAYVTLINAPKQFSSTRLTLGV